MIKSQLEFLKEKGQLEAWKESANPHYSLAKSYCWPSNYGYKAGVSTPEGLIALAELFHEYGFDSNIRKSEPGLTPLEQAALREAKDHPGMTEYVAWLRSHGAS